MAKRKTYTDVQRENAVGLAHDEGLAEAARKLIIPKATIHSWAKAMGVDVADEKVKQQVERATTMSVAKRRQKVAETKERLTLLMAGIAELGAHAQIQILKQGEFSLAEAVGATTRAIHDLQLLEGKPTEITEEVGEVELIKMRDELQALVERESGESDDN